MTRESHDGAPSAPAHDSDRLREWRRVQYARLARSQAWLLDRASHGTGRIDRLALRDLPRPARCGWPLGMAGVRLHEGRAFVTGAEHCASPWCCPSCTPVIRARRARDLRAAVRYWQDDPRHAIAFLTLTAPHGPADPLHDLIDMTALAWSRMRGGQAWRSWAPSHGAVHYVRSMEITWSRTAGWHCHLHVLLFLDHDFEPDELTMGVLGMWTGALHAVAPDRKAPSRRRGVLVEKACGDMLRLADYLSKTPDHAPRGHDLASEMTRADRKHARRSTGLNPFQMLDQTGDPDATAPGPSMRSLWLEYVDATTGRRSITWSRRLRREAGLSRDITDRQIIDDTVPGVEAFPLTPAAYHLLRSSPGIRAFVLQKTETGEVPLAMQVIDSCL